MSYVNPEMAIFLADIPGAPVRCLEVVYDPRKPHEKTLCKTFDQTIKIDDYVVVQTDERHNMTVCKVVRVDIQPSLRSSDRCRWILSKVDMDAHERNLTGEQHLLNVMHSAEIRKEREEMRKTFMGDLKPDETKLMLEAFGPSEGGSTD
jgi:hypothetical protein